MRWRAVTVPWLIMFGLFAMVYGVQRLYDQSRATQIVTLVKSITYNQFIEPTVPSVALLQHATFGFNTAIADFLWLQTIQYYGGGDPNGTYRKLPDLINAIITVDPKFNYPYSFAGIVMPNEGFADQALTILQQGEHNLPDSWEIPYDEGTIYYINKKDYGAAASAYTRASQKPGAPAVAKFLSAVQYDRSHDRDTAKHIFQSLADQSTNDYFKSRAQNFVDHYQLLDDLQGVVSAFRARQGRFPASLDELVQKHYVQSIPADPINRVLTYNPVDGTVDAVLQK